MKHNNFVYYVFLMYFLFRFSTISATNYYFANHGNDNTKEHSPKKPWKTIQRLNKVKLKPGDSVLFHTGHRFEGTIIIKQSGKRDKPIVITSYGKGEKPIITGAVKLKPYQKHADSLVFKTDKVVSTLFADNKIQTLARYPNQGEYLRMDGGGKDYLIESELQDIPYDVLHANARMRIYNWSYHFRKIVDKKGDTLFFDSEMCNTRLSQPGPCFCRPGWGYYFDNKKEFLDVPEEWFFEKETGLVYLKTGNTKPRPEVFEGTYTENGCVLENDVSYINVSNLHFTKYKNTGLLAKGFNDNIELSNCKFSHIFTMGVNFRQGSSHCVIKNNMLHDIYGSGLMLFEMNHFLVEGNQLQRIGLIPGYGLSGISGALGVCICNYETRTEQDTLFNHHNIFKKNHIDSTGWVAIRFDGRNNLMENNIIENANITCNDGGLVHTWGGLDSTYTQYSTIRNNIFRYSHGNYKDGAINKHNMSNGIYLDNGSHYMTVEDNTITGVNSGIHVNAGSYGNIINGNISYGNKTALSFAEWGNGRFWHKNNGNTAMHNILFNTYNLKHTLKLLHTYSPDFDPVTLDYNTYASPNEMYHITKTTVHGERKQTNEYTLNAWCKETGEDKNSVFIEIKKGTKSKIFINDSAENKEIHLDDKYSWMKVDKSEISGKIILEPYKSIILLYK